jgi:hypothetical protein
MAKFFTILFFALIVQISAQTSAPKFINYQGVARDASGTPITSVFDIQFTIKNATATVHNEFQNGIQPNALGLFSTIIGKAPNTLTVSAWDNGPFTLDVSINTGSSFTLVGSQPLVSVPFSLFAGNVPSSYTNNILTIGANSYSISAGSSITPTIIGTGLASVTPSTGPVYSVNVPTASLSYLNTSNILSLTQGSTVSTVTLTGSGSSSITMLGQGNAVVTPTFGSAFTVSVPPQVLTNVSNTLSLSNGGGNIVVPSLTLTNGSGITINGSWPTQTISASGTTNTPWVKSGNTVTLSALSDDVGLGIALPTSKLDVAGNATTTTSVLKVTNSNTNNSVAAIFVSSNGGVAIKATENSAAGANAGEFTSNNGGAIYGLTFEETKSAILGENLSVTSNSLAHGIYGKTNNPDANAAGIFGENLGNGHGIKGVTNGPSAAIRGINQYIATSAALADGVFGSTNNSSSLAAGVYGLNSGGGPGVFGTSSYAGVIGSGTGSGPGVQGNNSGSGPAIFGLKTNSAPSGNAGKFEINNASNPDDALTALTVGSGAAIKGFGNGTGPAIFGLKTNSTPTGNAGKFEINNASNPNDALTALTVGPAAAISGFGNGNGPAVYGQKPSLAGNAGKFEITNSNNPDHALLVLTNGNVSGQGSAIHGVASGNSPSIFGLKPSAGGNAGKFEITNAINPSPALHAITAGTGPAMCVTTGTLASASLGLLIENGHIKVTGSPTFNTSAGTHTVIGGYSNPVVSVNGNDVKGVISIGTSATGIGNPNYCDVKINFGKSYSANPIVVATPLSDLQGLSYMITNVQPSGFVLRLYRSANTNVPTVVPSVNGVFNYFVIE